MSNLRDSYIAAVKHLLLQPDLIKEVKAYFELEEDSEEWLEIKTCLENLEKGIVEIPGAVDEYLNESANDGLADVILAISWDSESWGPGGNGYIQYLDMWGVVYVLSSDYEGGIQGIYDPETWGPDIEFGGDGVSVTIDSDVYTDEELKRFYNPDISEEEE